LLLLLLRLLGGLATHIKCAWRDSGLAI
jgi:hypothetical protein